MTTSKQEPKLLEEPKHREMARRIRDHQWETLERIADKNPLYVCWWDKNRRHGPREHQPDDLKVCGLIDGMELIHWLKTHPEWTTTGDWSDERYAAPGHAGNTHRTPNPAGPQRPNTPPRQTDAVKTSPRGVINIMPYINDEKWTLLHQIDQLDTNYFGLINDHRHIEAGRASSWTCWTDEMTPSGVTTSSRTIT